MVTESPDRKVDTDAKIANDGEKRMPHERDESPDGQDREPRGVMKQAAADIEQGLVDTDLRATPGLEKGGGSGEAKPQQDAAQGMRDQTKPTASENTKK